MDDLNKPVRPIKADEDEKLKVQRIENYKQYAERTYQPLPEEDDKNKKRFFIACLGIVRKFFNNFIPESAGSSGVLSVDSIWQDLKAIRTLLIKIRDEDPADDPKFAEKFSEAWRRILDHYLHQGNQKKASKVDLKKAKEFIQAINHYPDGELHSLGFYLKKYGDEDWYPVPFFKILKQLHDEYFTVGKNSALDLWICAISEMLDTAARS
ncbi:MAG: hypothetical protein S4CHLAM37_05290 [Chlamydiia bacterium]|nr:hypothetical protein [Chlamydiia bacterium]